LIQIKTLGYSLRHSYLMRRTAILYTAIALAMLPVPASAEDLTLDALGELLFFDVNLSANRTQSCATCHDPNRAFTDSRGEAASRGDDGMSLGDRNAPTAMYAGFVPPLYQNADGNWQGGLFHDGRANSLAEQAGGPPLNPVEMGMPDRASVVARLRADDTYTEAFARLFGPDTLDEPDAGYAAMTDAIAAFERTEEFAPFTSRYDRWLRGEIELSPEEELGRVLFFSQQFTNCASCHLGGGPLDPAETFTNHSYHNIGTPENVALRAQNGTPLGTVDVGLEAVTGAPENRAMIRTPTLRNVAVSGPYMHNGVFADLRTVILYYNQFNTRSAARKINPETGQPFAAHPVPDTMSMDDLTDAPALDDRRIDALVAFLEALTDAKYEPLLAD
jgi:cytochrome c peroxidase